jgi:hypothetical protein
MLKLERGLVLCEEGLKVERWSLRVFILKPEQQRESWCEALSEREDGELGLIGFGFGFGEWCERIERHD